MGGIIEPPLLDFGDDRPALVVGVSDRSLVDLGDARQRLPAPLAMQHEPDPQLLTVQFNTCRHLICHGLPSIQRSIAARL
ncbi:hypothetical protein D3C75_1274510 [compost metagenome]